MAGLAIENIESEFVTHHITKKVDMAYFRELIHGIANSRNELDNHMLPYLKRGLNEIDPIELAVLRLAIYELAKRPDVPYRVVINEALELTKKFGSIEGYKFVNGVLDRVAKQIRENEIKGDL